VSTSFISEVPNILWNHFHWLILSISELRATLDIFHQESTVPQVESGLTTSLPSIRIPCIGHLIGNKFNVLKSETPCSIYIYMFIYKILCIKKPKLLQKMHSNNFTILMIPRLQHSFTNIERAYTIPYCHTKLKSKSKIQNSKLSIFAAALTTHVACHQQHFDRSH
jgi:hypothetical protein